MIEARLRSRVSKEALKERVGKVLRENDYDAVVTGPAKFFQPDGRPLFVYVPGVLKESMDTAYETLTTIRGVTTNRGLASGTPRTEMTEKRSYSMPVMSVILGSYEDSGNYRYCRLTAWTAKELEDRWPQLFPLFTTMGEQFKAVVPDRYEAQMKQVAKTKPEWVIPGTPYTTITVNNSYSTGVHTDKGDLDAGFSCLAVARRGNYTGGTLTFPEYRVAVNMNDGDLLLMDAHQWHGNTQMICECGNVLNKGPCKTCGAERVSVVAYFRTDMTRCQSAEKEVEKRLAVENRGFKSVAV